MPPGGPQGAGFPYNGVDYTWLTWGVGYRISDRIQIGGVDPVVVLGEPVHATASSASRAGASYRLNTHFGFAVVAHDFNGPSMQPLPPNGNPVLDRTFVGAAMAFRPTGTRDVELGFEGKYFDGPRSGSPARGPRDRHPRRGSHPR